MTPGEIRETVPCGASDAVRETVPCGASDAVRVSVVIPVYNVEAYLPACLDSVLRQSLREIEVICVDDASPDNCPAILDAYAAKDARVRVIHLPENRQQGYARNRGIDAARGTYVYLLDSDDMIEEEALAELAGLADRESLDAVFFDSRVIYESPQLARRYASYPAAREGIYPGHVTDGATLFAAFIAQEEWTCYIQRTFWRRAFLDREEIRFEEGAEHEDEFFSFAGILAAGRVRYIPARYFIRRYRENSVMTKKPAGKNFYGYFRQFTAMERFLRARGCASVAARTNLARIYERMVRYYGNLKDSEDLRAFCRTEEERRLFDFFAASMNAELYYSYLRPGLPETLGKYEKIRIYGAGVIAERAFRTLCGRGYVIEGFAVTKKEGNPTALFGHPVDAIGDISPDPSRLILLAMTTGYEAEVRPALRERGFCTTSFLDGDED